MDGQEARRQRSSSRRDRSSRLRRTTAWR